MKPKFAIKVLILCTTFLISLPFSGRFSLEYPSKKIAATLDRNFKVRNLQNYVQRKERKERRARSRALEEKKYRWKR